MPKPIARLLALLLAALALMPSAAFARDELKNTDPEKYRLVLDTGNQVITVYTKDDAGEYTRIVRRMICTTGKTQGTAENPASPTPGGTWKIGARERFGKFAAFGGEYARYWTQIVGGIYFHSIMFGKREITSLKSGPFSKLGSTASHGCVRLYVEDAKWIYYHVCPGTTVSIVSRRKEKGLVASLRTKMKFKEYDAFQQNIFDGVPLPDRTAWISVDNIQMRTGNGTNDKLIKKLKKDSEVIVLQEGDPWVKVLHDGREGYVKRCYITYEKGVMQSIPDGKYVSGTVYMYAEPSTKAERIYKIARDSTINVVTAEITPGWTLVDYWGTQGYVQSRQIKTGWATIYEQKEDVA